MNIMSNGARKAVVFGAGKMACGLLGQLLWESGFQTTFIARRPETASALNENNGYSVSIVGKSFHRSRVRNCSAISSLDHEAIIEAVATADIVFTAVGIDNIPLIAPDIAEGLWRRAEKGGRFLNIIASENLPGTGAYLRHQIVLACSSSGKAVLLDKTAGFSAALTHRIMTGGEILDGMLHFTVDNHVDLVIDSRGLAGALPEIHNTSVSADFDALFMEKLYTRNLAQAVAAYMGHQYGCQYIHEAAKHPAIAPVVEGAVAEAVAAFKTQFPALGIDIDADAAEAIVRISDPGLRDTVARIAKGPQRKLAAQERLLGPARAASRHGLPHGHLAVAIAAALAYQDEQDQQSVAMQQSISSYGVDKILTEVCGLLPHEPLAQSIKLHYSQLSAHGAPVAIAKDEELLKGLMQDMHMELSGKYERHVVSDVLAGVARVFEGARIPGYLPILMKKKVSERLRQLHGV